MFEDDEKIRLTVLTLYHQSFSEAIFVMKHSNGEKDDLAPAIRGHNKMIYITYPRKLSSSVRLSEPFFTIFSLSD